jgi:hypothetical protein
LLERVIVAVRPHDSHHILVVDDATFVVELGGNAPISVTWELSTDFAHSFDTIDIFPLVGDRMSFEAPFKNSFSKVSLPTSCSHTAKRASYSFSLSTASFPEHRRIVLNFPDPYSYRAAGGRRPDSDHGDPTLIPQIGDHFLSIPPAAGAL